jgi:serine protease inhibitor
MFLKYITMLAFLSVTAQAKNLSELVLDDQLSKNENYVFSNTSVDGLLSLVSFGLAKPVQQELLSYWGAKSLKEKAKMISSLSKKVDGVDVKVNYQVWLDEKYDLLPSYSKALSDNFSVKPKTMNVYDPASVVEDVNSWAATKTNNLVTKVIDKDFVTPDLISILANAVYFKGEWKNKFTKQLTEPKQFHRAGQVETMVNYEDYKFSWNEKDKVVVLELPFKGSSYSMIVAMSAKFSEYDFETDSGPEFTYKSGKNVKKVFKDYILKSKATQELQAIDYAGSVVLEMPKFTIETSVEDIQDMLSKIGLDSLFQSGSLANMTNDSSARLSKILQKAKIIVNEEGAEAAAVTVGGVVAVSAEAPPTTIKINGPFSYMIRNNISGEKLFEGVVTNPAAK